MGIGGLNWMGEVKHIWREPELGSTPTNRYHGLYSRIEDYELKESMTARGGITWPPVHRLLRLFI